VCGVLAKAVEELVGKQWEAVWIGVELWLKTVRNRDLPRSL